MAAVDPIENTKLCKYFPALTPKQVTNLCFYSTGANYQDISSLLQTAPGTIKKSLESVQKHYSAQSLPELKTVFWACFTFHLICAKYCIDGERFVATIHVDIIFALKPFFPELNKHQLAGAVLYSIGHSIRDIALKSHHSCAQVKQHIIEAMAALRIDSEKLLRMCVTSRFIMDLC